MITKVCTKCGVEKSIEEFVKDSKYTDGLFCWCRSCKRDYDAGYKNLPKIEISEKTCTKCHRTLPIDRFHRARSSRDGHHTACKDCKCKHQIDRYWHDPELRNDISEKNKAFYQEHDGQYKQRAYERKQRVRNAPGSHTRKEWLDLCKRYGRICLKCRSKNNLTRDHVIPVSRGGSDDISNIQPLCASCNASKGTNIVDYRPYYFLSGD